MKSIWNIFYEAGIYYWTTLDEQYPQIRSVWHWGEVQKLTQWRQPPT